MRALLKAVGIDAYTITIFSGDREHVRPAWPSAMQFNHAIVAMKVSPETTAATVVKSPAPRAIADLRSYRSRHAGWRSAE